MGRRRLLRCLGDPPRLNAPAGILARRGAVYERPFRRSMSASALRISSAGLYLSLSYPHNEGANANSGGRRFGGAGTDDGGGNDGCGGKDD